ncbi:MFS transporter [Corynebacterium guangdongense]|uniref:MFS family permease n=1 Tax=Corynebacterium guangdongense TaxID=1783348 RepID=A0ABU1ZUR3_9CORY|nr:MFS transporter [Corynebacterium guangdongense]MDR7328672.1 MFS family permease [Corynebacterium guangdongense]WJZ17249.1 Inner membrane metabolite transport protein YhjE [Corynebacterium guangdongense]
MTTTATRNRTEERRVLGATLIGTTVEWYDFLIYANAAAIIFAAQYFGPLGENSPQLAQILSYASIGISFFFRPLGAILAGWVGDRYGRRMVLMLTLGLMGVATTLMGLLPTYSSIGIAAPLLLVLLRILQGLSAGGEWGGAALMAVEHAPAHRRGLFGSYPQLGVPLGMLLATGVLLGVSSALSEEQFTAWGWRVPFLVSFLLIFIGFYIRRRVAESPVFTQLEQTKVRASAPVSRLLREHPGAVVRAAALFVGNNGAGYMIVGGFILGYGTSTLGLDRSFMLLIVSVGALCYLFTTLLGGWLSDVLGRRATYLIGYAALFVWLMPTFLLLQTAQPWLMVLSVAGLSVGLGLTYGPQSAAYSEMFPSHVRLSGVSIAYAIGAILGGAFAPMIAQLLVGRTGWIGSVGVYLMVLAAISFVAAVGMRESRGVPLTPVEEEAARQATTVPA